MESVGQSDTPREKVSGIRHTLPTISCGKKERAILRYLVSLGEERFNIKEFSRHSGFPRSTIYDALSRLIKYELVVSTFFSHEITEKGKILLEAQERGVSEGSRRECRKPDNLSTHYHRFRLPIQDRKTFDTYLNHEKEKRLAPLSWKKIKLINWYQEIIKFSDADIIINPHQVVIRLFDVVTEDVESSDFECFSRAIEYTKKLLDVGLVTEGIMLESAHWARVESTLSDFLFEKVDSHYFIDLGDGRKFWIDHSQGREDETNDKAFREKVDHFFDELNKSEHSFSDVGKIVEALSHISRIEYTRLKKEIEGHVLPAEPEFKPEGKAEYIG